MITEAQQEQATRFALGELSGTEHDAFSSELRQNIELREFVHSLQRTLDQVALSASLISPPQSLKNKIMDRLRAQSAPETGSAPQQGQAAPIPPGFKFLDASDTGWKPLPIPGAFIKLLSFQADRGYAVLMGKLDPGVRYPAHVNAGPEDFYILTGDLHIGDRALGPGDFHHADAGSMHGENVSVAGCTLLAVLTTDDPLVQLALG
jgi:anti-sigma factor ChrR (cupin superfamily)